MRGWTRARKMQWTKIIHNSHTPRRPWSCPTIISKSCFLFSLFIFEQYTHSNCKMHSLSSSYKKIQKTCTKKDAYSTRKTVKQAYIPTEMLFFARWVRNFLNMKPTMRPYMICVLCCMNSYNHRSYIGYECQTTSLNTHKRWWWWLLGMLYALCYIPYTRSKCWRNKKTKSQHTITLVMVTRMLTLLHSCAV